MSSSDTARADELRLRVLFDLPKDARAAAGEEFAEVSWRLLMPFDRYVRRLARPLVRDHEAEDIAREVIVRAAEVLKHQFFHPDKEHSRGWRHHKDPFAKWFKFFCGYPFKGTLSGEITNVINEIWSNSRHDSLDVEGASDDLADNALDPEMVVVEVERIQEDADNRSRLRLALEDIGHADPRKAFAVRMSFGVHPAAALDVNALVSIATDLGFSPDQRKLVKSEARHLELSPGQRELTQDEIAHLVGVDERTIRTWLNEVCKPVLAAAVRGPHRGTRPECAKRPRRNTEMLGRKKRRLSPRKSA
jgi:hypothetical protein